MKGTTPPFDSAISLSSVLPSFAFASILRLAMQAQTPIDEELLKQEYEILEQSNLNPKVTERAKTLLKLTLEIEQEVETKRKMQQGSMQHWREKMLECLINRKRWQYLEDEENWELIEKRLLEMRRANQEEARSVRTFPFFFTVSMPLG